MGLCALAPIAWMLATGGITLVDAALRATITLVVVVVVGRGAGVVVAGLAQYMEREAEPVGDAAAHDAKAGTLHS